MLKYTQGFRKYFHYIEDGDSDGYAEHTQCEIALMDITTVKLVT